jgi:hypothetical protein
MASFKDRFGDNAPLIKSSTDERKRASARALSQGMAEIQKSADDQRRKTEKLKQMRLERDAAEPKAPKKAPKAPAKASINLALTQRGAKK